MKFSVVIPVFNAEKYLNNALNSIINQTYKNIELILINDGSKDNSESLIDNFCKQNSNFDIKFKTIENQGPSTARNEGIKIATGDYICFLDSDDAYDTTLFEKINDIKENFDICYFGWEEKSENNSLSFKYEDRFTYNDGVINGKELAVMKLDNKAWLCNCNEVYKLSLLKENNILYPEGIFSAEDSCFIYSCLLCAEKVIALKYNGFINIIRSDSLMHGKFSKRFLTEFEAMKILIDRVDCYNLTDDDKKYFKNRFKALLYYARIIIAKKIIKDFKFYQFQKCKENLKKYIIDVNVEFKNIKIYLNKKKRIECFIYNISKFLFFIFVKVYYGVSHK